MPGKRSPNQRLVAFPLDEDLLSMVDEARGPISRSQFIRDALAEHLGLPNAIAEPPDRAGKKANPLPRKAVDYGELIKRKRKQP